MTTTPAPSITTFALAGSALGPFATGWRYGEPDDVTVVLIIGGVEGPALTRNVDYLLTASSPLVSGGSVTLSAALVPAGGWIDAKVALKRRTTLRQSLALPDTEGHKPRATEAALDKAMRIAQELADDQQQALRAAAGDALSALPFDRAGRFLAFDAERQPIAALGTVPGVPATSAAALLLDDATFADMRQTLGADKGENVSQAGTAAQAQAAPALSLARAGRQVVDVLRRVPDLALARAGAFDIAPYVRAEMQDWGAAQYVISDAGTLQWNSMVDLPSGAELRASNRDVRLRPGPGLGSASDLTGGCAIRIAQPQSGVRNIRWIGSQMGAAACVIIDAGGYSLNDTYVMECETVDVGAFCYDRGTGAGTAGVGRHFRTRVEDNVFRQLRGCPIRIRYGFGHLYYLRNVADFPGSNAPNQMSFDMDGAAMSALPDAGGLFFSMVMGGTASEGASQAQRGALFKNTGEITLETGSAGDGLGGVAFDFDTVRLLRPDKVLARYCNDVAVRFKDVDNIEGGDFDIVGRHGLPGAASNKDAVRLEGACANFNINRIAADSATGHAFHRVDGSMPLISVTRLIGRNCARRMLQLSGGSGSFFAAAATSVNNNLTGVDATANYETTSVADKIANFQLPSGGVTAVTAPGAG